MLIGRKLCKNESGNKWADSEPIITDEDPKRIAKGQRLEDKGFSFLADPTGENSIDDSFNVVTPREIVLTPFEVRAYKIIGCAGLSSGEIQIMKDSHEYLLAYSPEFFD